MILDIGAGDSKKGDVGVDLYRGKGVDVLAHAEFLPFRSESFLRVNHHCVLEHLGNPLQAIIEQRRVLCDGGTLSFVTDNAAYWRFYVGKEGAHIGGYDSRGTKDRHLVIFTSEHLKNLVEDAGLRIESLSYEDIKTGPLKSIERVFRRWKRFEHLTYPRLSVEATKETSRFSE